VSADRDTTVITRTVARIVFPLVLLTAIALLLQGHNRPGGGFISGVLTAAAVALVYIVYGLEYLEGEVFHRVPSVSPDPTSVVGKEHVTVVAAGLTLAAGGGIAAMAYGSPFLTQAVMCIEHLPIYGELEVASALVFDLGVYVVVVGSLLTILGVVGAE
jgi:multicomponent Na+:H+ antiporter subunit B